VITAASCIIEFNSVFGVPFSAENVEFLLGNLLYIYINLKKGNVFIHNYLFCVLSKLYTSYKDSILTVKDLFFHSQHFLIYQDHFFSTGELHDDRNMF
jgi:hypothetical protein